MIEVNNVTKIFDTYHALDHVSCKIPEGCVYGMVGSNGAGKSTLLRLLSGVYQPEEGDVEIDGVPVFENPAVKADMFFVPDELFFLHGASLKRMAQLYKRVYPRFDEERFHFLTSSFNLNEKAYIHTFSKGMKRQAATILALSTKPKYILFDETFDGLDPVMRNLVKNLISQDVADRKATAIITSHSLRELEDTCDQLALLHKGGLIFESDIMNLKTSLFKVQVAYSEEYDRDKFEDIEILKFSKRGSVSTMIVRGDREETTERLWAMSPILLELLPLSLEEVFTYEMEALGYEFHDVFLDEKEREVRAHEK
ncbi:MAG: ABC transporter ATP-binding protein [Lachnospiraceae bacterium]|nr:ABC transporter ATP-binding protein [Lachnospiraceae bacterium]